MDGRDSDSMVSDAAIHPLGHLSIEDISRKVNPPVVK